MKTKKFLNGIFGKNENEDGNVNINENANESINSDPNSDPNINANENENGGKICKVYNLIIVDESGSMSGLRESTLSGINEVIGTIRNAQKEFAETQQQFLTLVTFDSRGSQRDSVRTIIDNEPIENVKDFKNYNPNGCTPLYDAMGMSISRLKQQIGDDKMTSAVVTVMTDGLENASQEWNAQRVKILIEQLKEQGWSFSYMGSAHNVKEVTDLLSIENFVEFEHDNTGAANTWAREHASRMSHYGAMHRSMMANPFMEEEEFIRRKKEMSRHYYNVRVTPDNITQLESNEIFVFGSNAAGMHNGGAARFAVRNFGAIKGQGEGLQGQSYAIPTMEGIEYMKDAIMRFADFAERNVELKFLVTRVGCGIAGYDDKEIAPLFKRCIGLENVSLPIEFWSALGLKM